MKKLILLCAVLAGCSDGPCDPDEANTICTIAGTGGQGSKGDGGPAVDAKLYVPQDTAVSPDGELWILDFNNYLVRVIDDAGIIRTEVGNGDLGDSPPAGVEKMPARDATFNHTSDLFFAQGYLYMAAWHNSRIKRVNLADMMIENYAGRGIREYYDGDGGPRLLAALDLPSSIALSPAGDIVIMDQANQVVRRIDPEGNIHRIVGTCVVDLDVQCAPGVQPVSCRSYMSSDKTACGDPAVECVKPCTPGYGGDGGPALEARIAQPYGQMAPPAGRIVYDTQGNLLIADSQNNRIRKVDAAGIITTLAGSGEHGYSGDGGPATEAALNHPIDVEVAPDGTVYFADTDNNCIRKVTTDGIIHRVAGTCSDDVTKRGFSGDGGDPLNATMDRPHGIELDGNKLYIADSYNNRIRVANLP